MPNFNDNMRGAIDGEWLRPKTTRRYLHPPKAERMFTLWREGKIILGDVVRGIDHRSYAELDCAGIWLVHTRRARSFDMRRAESSLCENGAPIHSLTNSFGGFTVDMEAFCNIERRPTCFVKITVKNNAPYKASDRIGLLLRSGKECELVHGSPDEYLSYDPEIADFKDQPVSFKNEGGVYRSGEYFLTALTDLPLGFNEESGLLLAELCLEAQESAEIMLSFGKGKEFAFDYNAEKQKALRFWKGELESKEAYSTEKVVLIENEFGEIGIDGGFLQDAGVNITEMNSGCICCSLVGDFTKALSQVYEEYKPDRIVIEPSGVGKLSDVIRAAQAAKLEGAELNALTTVVDAGKCKMYMKNFGEFFNDQLKHATCIVLSHTDTAPEKKINDSLALIREQNATATVVTTPWSQLDGADILATMEQKDTLADALSELVHEHEHHHHHHDHDEDCDCGCHEHEHEHEHHHHHDHGEDCDCGCHEHEHEHHHHHDHGENCDCGCHGHHHHHADEVFTSWGAETARKYTKEEILAVLETFSESDDYGMILRAKGIVAGVDGNFIHFDYTPGEPDVRTGCPAVIGRLCVIGSKINEDEIAKLFFVG